MPIGLRDRAISLHDEYVAAEPFPHIVIDGLLDEAVLDQVLDQWPADDSMAWKLYHGRTEWLKKDTAHPDLLGDATRQLLRMLTSDERWLEFVSTLTGITGLTGDIWGGGLHEVQSEGKLSIHADFNVHPSTGLHRRLNLLLFLNKDWPTDWGGDLELWDADVSRCIQAIQPLYNRLVIFTCSDTSYHGHPDELTCPPDQTRKSIAVYYYTEGTDLTAHSTLYKPRPTERF